METTDIYLVDNGSLRPTATLELRCLAARLSEASGRRVRAASLLHSDKVDPEALGGTPAELVESVMTTRLEDGVRRFVFVPLFLGPSLAITEYLPSRIEAARQRWPDLKAVIAPPLAGDAVAVPDPRLACMVADHVRACIMEGDLGTPKVALVDHGTPVRPVNQLRDAVADQLSHLLGSEVACVKAASMERRDGAAYAFNEPLLENLGAVEGFGGGCLVAAMFFLLPGRHAGVGGDVAGICEGLVERGSFERVETTRLLGEHPLLLRLLRERMEAALAETGAPVGTAS